MFEAAIDFERRFGGARFELGARGSAEVFDLGIDWAPPKDPSHHPDDPGNTLVPIGSGWNGYEYLYMNARGEITCYFDRVIMMSSSIVRYIEQRVIGLVFPWGRRAFGVDLTPAVGERLSQALGLSLIGEASDPHVSWWSKPGLLVEQVYFEGSWKARQTSVFARSITGVARAIRATEALDVSVAVSVGSTPFETARLTRRQRERAPTPESWASKPDARRYRFGNEDKHMTGTVWLLGARGTHTIQQYRVFKGEEGERLLAWDTFTAEGGTSRDMDD